jgi:hypothetical protein
MSRGLGSLQSEIKTVLTALWKHGGSMRFANIRAAFLYAHGGEEGDTVEPIYERSVWRALNGLLARGDVVVISGQGTSGSPREYMCAEDFAALSGERIRDAAHARKIAAEGKKLAAGIVATERLYRSRSSAGAIR